MIEKQSTNQLKHVKRTLFSCVVVLLLFVVAIRLVLSSS